jgi:enoyl-CoA hydratase
VGQIDHDDPVQRTGSCPGLDKHSRTIEYRGVSLKPDAPDVLPSPKEVTLLRHGTSVQLVIDRPRTRNAISDSVMSALEEALDELDADPPVALAIRGAGDRAFISGGDLKEFATIRERGAAVAMSTRVRTILDRIAGLPSITIAELNGHALGGGAEVAVAADLRIAADDVKIGFSQIRLGIMPAWGGVERLTTLVGRARAMYLLTTGVAITAQQAYAWGLVEEVVPRDSFEQRCSELREMLSAVTASTATAIGALVSAVRPSVHEATAPLAIESFATSWVSDEHWAAVEPAKEMR